MIGQVIGLMLATAAAPPPPAFREFKDWIVACDNLRTCRARWAPEEGDGGFDAYLDISRDAGPAGTLRLSLSVPGEDLRPDVRTLKLDGRPIGRGLLWRHDAEAAAMVLRGASALDLVRTLREGNELTYSDGQTTRTVTLRGLKAALLAIDEAQGRLGTAGAFVRTGPAVDAGLPAAPPLPVVIARPPGAAVKVAAGFAAQMRQAQAAVLTRNECQADFTESDEAYPLTRTEVLVVLGCARGAYQGWVLAFRGPRDAPQRAKLLVLPPGPGDEPRRPDDEGAYTEGGFDPETATFFEAAKGRGLADCGSSTQWVFDGTAFRLAEASRMRRCTGGPPGDWPTVYRSKTEVRR